MAKNHILKNLHSLIRNSTLAYMNEFIWQDIELTNEFKEAYSFYLKKNRYDIEFLGSTAVITSSSTKYIYVPNQWFVIASYVVDVYDELQLYKEYFKKVAERLHIRPDDYAKLLRDTTSISDKKTFMNCAREVFASFCSNQDIVEESSTRLWRFVNDYAWWSGQKTIDRGDFYISVILNMLNLVNVSQGYVADIVSAYANDPTLRMLVKSIDGFTVNYDNGGNRMGKNYELPDEEISCVDNSVPVIETETIPKPERVRIKIGDSNTLKEIKYKG